MSMAKPKTMKYKETANPEPEKVGWSYGLLRCFDDSELCFLGFFCPCYLWGKTRTRLNPESSVWSNCFIYLIKGPNKAYGGWETNRETIRRDYGIAGSCFEDCMTHLLCHCCAVIQEEREMRDIDGE